MVFNNYDLNFIAENFPAHLNVNGILNVRGTQIMRSACLLGRGGFLAMLQKGVSLPDACGAIAFNSLRIQLLLSRQGNTLIASSYYQNAANKNEKIPHSTFIGEVFAEVAVRSHLNVQKLIHVEQIDQNIIPLVFGAGLKPDFIGQSGAGWVVIEAKGTITNNGGISQEEENQAANLTNINGHPPTFNCVSKTFFRNGLSINLRNVPFQPQANAVINGLNINDNFNLALDRLQNNPEILLEEVEVINGENVRFIDDNYLTKFMGMEIGVGFATRLLLRDNVVFEPFSMEDDEVQVEMFSDGTVIRMIGEINEVNEE